MRDLPVGAVHHMRKRHSVRLARVGKTSSSPRMVPQSLYETRMSLICMAAFLLASTVRT